MAKKPIKVTEVVLRDAHQSLLATRMTMDEMRPILPEMDKINYFSVECWGGATFDSCIQMCIRDRRQVMGCSSPRIFLVNSGLMGAGVLP